MSAIIKTVTPFLEKDVLLEALNVLGVKYQLNDQHTIITERVDYYGNQLFVWNTNRYVFQHDSSANREHYIFRNLNVKEWKTVASFLQAVEKTYKECYQAKLERLETQRLEEERQRIEAARIALVQQQIASVKEKAEKMGYKVSEKKVGNKTQLVLIKNTY